MVRLENIRATKFLVALLWLPSILFDPGSSSKLSTFHGLCIQPPSFQTKKTIKCVIIRGRFIRFIIYSKDLWLAVGSSFSIFGDGWGGCMLEVIKGSLFFLETLWTTFQGFLDQLDPGSQIGNWCFKTVCIIT